MSEHIQVMVQDTCDCATAGTLMKIIPSGLLVNFSTGGARTGGSFGVSKVCHLVIIWLPKKRKDSATAVPHQHNLCVPYLGDKWQELRVSVNPSKHVKCDLNVVTLKNTTRGTRSRVNKIPSGLAGFCVCIKRCCTKTTSGGTDESCLRMIVRLVSESMFGSLKKWRHNLVCNEDL